MGQRHTAKNPLAEHLALFCFQSLCSHPGKENSCYQTPFQLVHISLQPSTYNNKFLLSQMLYINSHGHLASPSCMLQCIWWAAHKTGMKRKFIPCSSFHVHNDYRPNSIIIDTFSSSDVKTPAVKLYNLPVHLYLYSICCDQNWLEALYRNPRNLEPDQAVAGDPPADGCLCKRGGKEGRQKEARKQTNT